MTYTKTIWLGTCEHHVSLGRRVKTFIYDISIPAKRVSMDMCNIKTYNNNTIIIISTESKL